MGMHCTRCDGTGWLNTHQIPDGELNEDYDDPVQQWLDSTQTEHDVCECDCCDGSGEHGQDEQTFDCM